MNRLRLLLIAIFLGAAFFAFGMKMTGGHEVRNSRAVLEEINILLMHSPKLDLVPTDCKPLFPSTSEYRRCFVSHSDRYMLPKNLAKVLTPIAFTLGWSDDANVPGAFYSLSDNPKQTFSITVVSIQETDRLKKISVIKKFTNFFTLRIDEN